jgi:hypothetical protein
LIKKNACQTGRQNNRQGLHNLFQRWPGGHELIKIFRVMKQANTNISLRTYTCTIWNIVTKQIKVEEPYSN